MTLSGKSERQERADAARAARAVRQQRAALSAAKRPWLLPVVVCVAVLVVAGVVVFSLLTGVTV